MPPFFSPQFPKKFTLSPTAKPDAALHNPTQTAPIDLQKSTRQSLKWWGDYHFNLGQARTWRFGTLLVRITRGLQEWQLEYYRPRVQDEDEQSWQVIDNATDLGTSTVLERYFFQHTGEYFWLLPRLAHLPVVVRPHYPIYFAAGEHGTLYLSTPLWIAGYHDPGKPPLFDIPVVRPKDTWFGPDTRHGEVCFATPVVGRTELSHLLPRAFRAVTPVHVHNQSNGRLPLLRMNLPVPALPLFYQTDTFRLWTSPIDVVQDSVNHAPRIRIDSHAPGAAGSVDFLAPAREAGNQLFRMFDTFF